MPSPSASAPIVGGAQAGLPPVHRRRVIAAGIAAATVLRIAFAAVTMHLLAIVGLTLAGGLLLLWVVWKMYRELCDARPVVVPADGGATPVPPPRPQKTTTQAMCQIGLAHLSMSVHNVI